MAPDYTIFPLVASHTDFSRSGHPRLKSGTFSYLGINGAFWSSMIKNDSENTYYYVFDPGSSYVAYDITRSYGFSLRCLSSLPRPSGRGRV